LSTFTSKLFGGIMLLQSKQFVCPRTYKQNYS